MNAFTALFVCVLLLGLAARLALMQRHRHHVQAHRDRVPEAFADAIPLASHQRAADYTAARVGLGMRDAVAGVVLVLVLTLGGGLQFIHDAWAPLLGAGGRTTPRALVRSRVRWRPASIAASVDSLAVAWMHPPPFALVDRNDPGSPIAPHIQSSSRVSSSVAPGLVAHSIPFTPSPALKSSPMIAGKLPLHGKYA